MRLILHSSYSIKATETLKLPVCGEYDVTLLFSIFILFVPFCPNKHGLNHKGSEMRYMNDGTITSFVVKLECNVGICHKAVL